MSGGTVTGNTIFTSGLTATTISATTYQNLPNFMGDYLPLSGGTVTGNTIFTSGLTATTISATTYQNLPIDPDTYTTGFTYNTNVFTIKQNNGQPDLTATINSVTGWTVNGDLTITGNTSVQGLTATTISATTYQNLPDFMGDYLPLSGGTVTGDTIFTSGLTANTISATTYQNLPVDPDTYTTGFTYNTNVFTIKQNNGQPDLTATINSVTGWTVNGDLIVTGNTSVQGLTATTISATTYQNLPVDPDSYVTGFTLNSDIITLSQNRNDQYSAFTISLSAYTGNTGVSGDYLPLSGGTVTGGTIFQSGVTANTISNVDYINFETSPTVPSPTGGTLYFDSGENALSYKPITNQNDVTVNLGQESLIRIFNNLPYQINNGQVLHITGATSGVSNVALANASKIGTSFTDSLAQTSGVATHDIPSGEYGFMTNFGVVRDINTSAFTVGQEVFLSDTIDGGIEGNPNNIVFTSRISTVGYCLESNATTGKILVSIINENQLQSLTQQQVNVLLGNTISTGVFNFTGITLASSNTFNVAPVDAFIVDNTTNPLVPEVLYVEYSGQTNIPSLYYSSATETYLLLTSASTITQQITYPTPQQRRQNVYLGKMGHGNKTSLINAFNEPDLDVSPISQVRDMFTPIKLINDNVYPSPNSNLTFNNSSGTIWGLGIGFTTNQLNPSSLSVSGNSPTTFQYRTQTGGTATNRTTIDPANYDLNGVITSIGMPAKQATNQRIFLLQNGQFRIQYGQTKYTDLTTAIAAVNTESFTTFSNFIDNAVLIAILSVRSDATILTDTLQAKITFASKFGESVGGTGGISTTTLQQAYDNSSEPEIVINSTLDGFSIKNGTGNADNVSQLLQGINSGGTVTSFIRADGAFSGTSIFGTGLTATTISATTYQNLPVDPDTYTTGFTYNNNIFTIKQNNGQPDLTATINSVTGWTVNGNLTVTGDTSLQGLTATTISATTYQNLPTDIRVTGGTILGSTIVFTNNTGGTFNVTGLTDTFVTGGTYSSGTTTFTNNSGGTFNVTGFTGTWMNGFVNQTMISGSTLYYYINGSVTGAVFASRTARQTPFAGLKGTARYLVLRINTAQPASGQISIGLHINASSSSLKITIPAGSAAGVYSDLTNSASLTQLDLLSYEIINSATTGTQAGLQTVGFMVF